MGDLNKAFSKPLKWMIPLALMLVGAGVFAIGNLGIAGAGLGFSALQGFTFGMMLSGLSSRKKRAGEGPAAAVQYGLSKPGNTLDRNRAIPIIYGKLKIDTGNTVWARVKTDQEQDRAVVLCQGPVESVTEVKINDRLPTDYTGCSASAYTGTWEQANDARLTGYYKGSMKGLAYVAATVAASEQLRSEPVISALVKGRKVDVWDGDEFIEQWSDNPAWIIRDFLINFCGIPESYIDEDSFIDVGGHCDPVVSGEYDYGDNVAPAGTCTGSIYPEHGNDGSRNTNLYWYKTCEQNETLYELGQLDLGVTHYPGLLRLFLYDGDDREFYNYKITASANGSDWDTLVDRTGSGVNYKGCQDIEFTPENYRYFKIYGSGSSLNADFVVCEVEVFELEAVKRYRLNAVIDSERQAQDILKDILSTFGGSLIDCGDRIKLICDRGDLEPDLVVAASDMAEGSVVYSEIPRSEMPNRVEVQFIDPFAGWRMNTAVAEDPAGQDADGTLEMTITFPFCTSRSQAARMARQAMNYAREVRYVSSWTGELGALGLEPGDIVSITDAEAGWSAKPWRVTEISRTPSGLAKVSGIEHIESIFEDEPGGSHAPTTTNRLPAPDAAPYYVTNLTLTEDKDQHEDGTWLPKILVNFTPPGGGPNWARADIEVRAGASGSFIVAGWSRGEEFQIKNLRAGVTYWVRVVSVSEQGIKANSNYAPLGSLTVAGKEEAPGNVSGFNFSVGPGYIELVWNSAWDANNDLDHYEIRDGASWAAGTLLFDDLSTTRKTFKPTKRTYHLWIKAHDRTGNESLAACELNIAIAAPTLAGPPELFQIPPRAILVSIETPDNALITHYDVHVSTSSSFTPSAVTLKTTAGKGIAGLTTVMFDGIASTTYYVKVCAIDFLSYSVGDQFTWPSSEESIECVLIGGDDIYPNTVTTNHLSTSGIDVGDGTGKPVWIRVIDSVGAAVAWIGKSGAVAGGWFKTLGVGGTGFADAKIKADASGNVNIDRSVTIGTTDSLLSNAESAGNLWPNGDFEMEKFSAAVYWDNVIPAGDPSLIPCHTLSKLGAGSDNRRPGIIYKDSDVFGGKYCLFLESDADEYCLCETAYIPVIAGQKYQISIHAKKYNSAVAPSFTIGGYYYDRDFAYVSAASAYTSPATTTAWTRYSTSFTVPAGTGIMYLRVRLSSNTSAGYQCQYFDNGQIERGEVVTAYKEPALAGARNPMGMALDETGLNVYSAGSRMARLGNIGGLSDGEGGSLADPTMGLWLLIQTLAILNPAGNLMMGIDGVTGNLFLSTPIALSWMAVVLQATIEDSGDPDRPHTNHFAIAYSDTIALTDAWPVTYAHGLSYAPLVQAQLRGKDTGGGTYTRWEQMPTMLYHVYSDGGGCHLIHVNLQIDADTTNIYFRAFYEELLIFGTNQVTNYGGEFSAATKTGFWFRRVSDGVMDNIWDQLEIDFDVFREGV